MAEPEIDEASMSVDDARRVFYSAGDYHLARSLQQQEFDQHADTNKRLRLRVQQSVDQAKADKVLGRQLLSDEELAKKFQAHADEATALEEHDKSLAEELQRQLSLEGNATEDEKQARELQDQEFAVYLHEKQKAREQELLLKQHLQEEEARRLQEEEVRKWREEKEKAAMDDQAVAQQIQQTEQMQSQKERDRQAEDEALARQLQQNEVRQYKQAKKATVEAQAPVDPSASLPARLGEPAEGPTGLQRRKTSPSTQRSSSSGSSPSELPTTAASASVTHLANPDQPGDPLLVPKMNKRRAVKKK